jgi:hypothetical protein
MHRIASALLITWCAIGRGEPPEPQAIAEPPITTAQRQHWSFRPLSQPVPPAVRDTAWPANSIDRFILAKIEASGLRPMPPADRVALIRRVTFDLTGLPPRLADVDAFVADRSPDAYARLLDRLLASPAYGERWGQHWLDLARFAESDGFEHDHVRPNAWRFRDWVIDALNRDVPYDEFVRLQVAGDELRPGDAAAAIATGFNLCGPDMPDINLKDERRHMVLGDMTATLGAVFLGLQLGCAQCHDSKQDPISQADFYRLRAFFDSAEFFDEATVATPAERADYERRQTAVAAERRDIEQELQAIERPVREQLSKDRDPQSVIKPEEVAVRLSEQDRLRHQQLTARLGRLKGRLPALPVGRVLREAAGEVPPSRLMIRGDFRRPGPAVEPAFLRIANLTNAPVPSRSPGAARRGNRSALAMWLTQPDHPLTTRVVVNRLWQHHFGRGLVQTPSDFGLSGDLPVHPELLDWLAGELVEQGWSLKQMHRLMLSSATYCQASYPANDAARLLAERSRQVDPENRLWARRERIRLDGESIRDAMLAAADRLSPQRGGPGVMPPLPQELVATLLKGQWAASPDPEHHQRRSVYIFVRRNLRYPLLDVFDRPDTNASCPQRMRSTTPTQALSLLNSEFSEQAAGHVADWVLTQLAADRVNQVERCYGRVLGRRPAPAERDRAVAFLAQHAEGRTALVDLCVALFNCNEFVYLD